jgi:hypothetical protein
MHRENKQCIPTFVKEDMKERDHLEELEKEGRVILKWILEKGLVKM